MEERSLIARIKPVIDDNEIQQFANDMSQTIKTALESSGMASVVGGGDSGGDGQKSENSPEVKTQMEIKDGIEEQNAEQSKLRTFITDVGGKITEGGAFILGLFKGIGDIIGDLWKRIIKISPPLESLMDGFNSVISLVWLPFGVALAEVFVPILTDLMEIASGMAEQLFEAYTDGGIGALFTEGIANAIGFMFEAGIRVLSAIPEGTVIGSIASLTKSVLDFVQRIFPGVEKVVEFLSKLAQNIQLVATILGGFVGAWISYKLAEATMGFLGNIPGIGALKLTGLGIGLSLGIGAGVGAGVGYGVTEALGYADGGYIESTPGGRWINVAEGGEGEFVVPKSKVGSFVNQYGGGTNNFYITINGYTDNELKSIITDTVNDLTNKSRLRGSF